MAKFTRSNNSRGPGGRSKSFGGRSGGFGNRSGGFGKPGGFRRRDSEGPTQKYDATCSRCGKPCQLPFKPRGIKPVLCDDCFSKSRSERGSSFQSGGASSDQMKQMDAKLDKILSILQKLDTDVEEASKEVTEEDEGAE